MPAIENPSPLLEREEEEERIGGALGDARDGAGRFLVVQAAGGLGKTSLLAGARRRARELDMRVLGGRRSELESGFPFGIVRQLFEPALYEAGPGQRDALLAGAAALARPMFDDAGAVLDAGAEDATFPRLHGLYWLTANLARERPLLLTVDDAHWSDEPSLKFLSFLVRRLEDLPILVLVGTRPTEEALSPVLGQLLTDPLAEPVRPAPLSDDAVTRWIREATSDAADEEFCAACHLATSGNPLLMSELLREVAAEGLAPTAGAAERVATLGPRGISRVVLLRLARLPEGAVPLARAVAVLGDSAQLATAAALAGLDPRGADDSASLLVRAQVLVAGDTLGFVHPIVRAAIYEDVPALERAELHARAARLLTERHCTPQEVAAQVLATPPGGEEWVVGVLREAARRALALGDSPTAVRYLERALAEPPPADRRAQVLAELGRAEARTGAPGAADHLEAAIALAPDPRAAAEAALELSGLLKFSGQAVRAVDVLQAAGERLGPEDADLAERLQVELIGSAMISLRARPLLAGTIERLLVDPGGEPRSFLDRAVLSGLAFNGFAEARPAAEVADLASRALSGGDLPTDPVAGGHAFVSAVIALMFAERYDEAARLYGEALDDARSRGSAIAFATASSLRSLVRYRQGRLAAAYADATAALDLADEVEGAQGFLAAALGTLIYTDLDRGTVSPELEALAERFLHEQANDSLPYSHAIHSRACVRVERGDLRRGLAELLAAGDRELAWGARNPAITPWRSSAALVLRQLGDDAEARRLADEEVALARSFGAPRCLGVALRAAGLVHEDGVALLREAVAVLERSAGQLELARALIDLGAMLRRAGDRTESREHLRRGQDLAARCEAARLVDLAYDELLASGARPRRTATSGAESLTPSQRRVAEMAARGLTNRDIAQALFVTEKTVETHLGHVYSKLDLKSRTQLADVIGAEERAA